MIDHRLASSSVPGARARAWWILLVLLGGVLLVIAAYLWQLSWTSEAVVIGPVWTPHIAIGCAMTGVTCLAAFLILVLRSLQARYQRRSWSFELTALAVTGVVVVWLGAIGLTCLGFLPADAHFTETQSGDRVIVTRTSGELRGVTVTQGVRSGLLVRWGASTFKHN